MTAKDFVFAIGNGPLRTACGTRGCLDENRCDRNLAYFIFPGVCFDVFQIETKNIVPFDDIRIALRNLFPTRSISASSNSLPEISRSQPVESERAIAVMRSDSRAELANSNPGWQ